MSNKAGKPSPINSEPQIAAAEMPENRQWIAESAYYKALARGFIPHHDQEDWLEAKKDYQALLARQRKNGLVSLRQA
jgi:hypothetical protein